MSTTSEQLGYAIIDADTVAHQALAQSLPEITEAFGNEVINDNQVNRAKLGEIVFNNAHQRQILEAIIHPKVRAMIGQQAQALQQSVDYYFIDVPLFFESNSPYPSRAVVLVYCPKPIAMQRLMQRNQLTQQQALVRWNAQMDIEDKVSKADYIVDNSGDERHFNGEFNKFCQWLSALKRRGSTK